VYVRGVRLVIVEVREKVNNAAKPNKQQNEAGVQGRKNGGARRIAIPSHSKVVDV